MDLFAQNPQQDRVIELVETLSDITLNEPRGTPPSGINRLQRGVTAPASPEPMRVIGKLWFVIRVKEHTNYFLQQFVRPRRQTKRAFLRRRAFLGDVDSPCWLPSIALIAQRFDDCLNLVQTHAVHGFWGDAGRHCTVVAVDLPVGD